MSVKLPPEVEAACDAAAVDAAQAKRSELRFLAVLNLHRAAPTASTADMTMPALVDKATVAQALGMSKASVDRWVLGGMPVHAAGTRRRFDLAEVRTWLDARGPRPAKKATTADDDRIDIGPALRSAGLRVVGNGR